MVEKGGGGHLTQRSSRRVLKPKNIKYRFVRGATAITVPQASRAAFVQVQGPEVLLSGTVAIGLQTNQRCLEISMQVEKEKKSNEGNQKEDGQITQSLSGKGGRLSFCFNAAVVT